MPEDTALLDHLNDAQRKAVLHADGPLVVFAGAGSGKTRVITTRVAHLVSKGVAPWEILAVTFTNKAAQEMRTRLLDMTPEGARIHVATFHSACARWLREFATELGFSSTFAIYDDKDSTQLLKRLLKEQCTKKELANLAAKLKSFIQWAKTRALLPSEVEKAAGMTKDLPPGAIETYHRYQEALANANAMDFSDLLMNTLLLLRRNEKVRNILQQRYRYIMVDEFQDTNAAQFELVMKIAQRHQNLCVVGDDDQSIYSWRGANPLNIMKFEDHFEQCNTIALERNYRCTGNIVRAAASLIANNKTRAEKTLFTENPSGDLIDFSYEADGEMEARMVAGTISSEKAKYPFKDIAIFYRTNSQTRLLEESLHQANIPYMIYGSLAFYDRMEIKDLLAYLRLLANEKDDISLTRIINVPTRGIGAKTVTDLESYAKSMKLPLMPAIREAVNSQHPVLSKKLTKFLNLMKDLERLKEMPLGEVLNTLENCIDYKAFVAKRFPDQLQDKIDNIHELGAAMAAASMRNPTITLNQWLEDITLNREESSSDKQGGISLMTLHMAKGLEFDRVYIVGTEDGLIPHQNNQEDQLLLEEERRLFYVGITRAKKKLSLYAARRRQTYNQYNQNDPSRFLLELPKEVLSIPTDAHQQSHQDPYSDELSYAQDLDPSTMQPGQRVEHPTYGAGTITSLSESFGMTKVIVHFPEFGTRKISPSQLKTIVDLGAETPF